MANYEVRKYQDADIQAVLGFMSKVTDINGIDLEIVKNSSLVFDEEQVAGMVSYERIDEIGVIRYFIYNHYSLPDLLVNMFFNLYADAKKNGVERLVALVANPHAHQLFELLGFAEVAQKEKYSLPHLPDSENASVMSISL